MSGHGKHPSWCRSQKEILAVTVDDVTYQRRVRVFELAQELGNVSAACRAVDVSRNSYFQLLARPTPTSTCQATHPQVATVRKTWTPHRRR
jgi:hypothetical protein